MNARDPQQNAQWNARRLAATPRGVGVMTDRYAERAENAEVWDVEGRRYIDFAGGIAVLNTGHRHPKIVAAVKAQLDQLHHTCFQVLAYEPYVALAEKLIAKKKEEIENALKKVDWKAWIGVAPDREFWPGIYHTFQHRGWWDFGTGALGDMACHTVNLPFMALDLRNPIAVEGHSSGHNKDSYPKSCEIKFEFAATKNRPAINLYWYDGTKLPPQELLPGVKFRDSGSLIIGDKGKLYTPGDYGGGGEFFGGIEVEVKPPSSPGHFEELIRAIKDGIPAQSNFPDYAGPLTETILLGNLAIWSEGKRIEWDSHSLSAKNVPGLNSLIKPRYRNGYSV